jgi:hypothetical protein
MSLARTQKLFHDLCFEKEFYFNKKTLLEYTDENHAAFLLKQDEARHLIYRELVAANIFSVLEAAYLLLFCLLDDNKSVVREFLHRHRARAHFYRHIAGDFLDFLNSTPPHLFEEYPVLLELIVLALIK